MIGAVSLSNSRPYRLYSICLYFYSAYSKIFQTQQDFLSPLLEKCSTRLILLQILYFNRFRRKPAIPSLISLSPLSTIHPNLLQQTRVQPSTPLFAMLQLDHGQITWIRVIQKSLWSFSLRIYFSFYARHFYILVDPLYKRYRVILANFSCFFSIKFHILFNSPLGIFSTFPHGTCTLSISHGFQGWKVVFPFS